MLNLKFRYEYFNLLEQLRQMLARKSLKPVDSTCGLDEIFHNGVWADDVIEHVFRCTACKQHFRLIFETYHLSGGTWEPADHGATWISRFK
jgi:hypothetical protein